MAEDEGLDPTALVSCAGGKGLGRTRPFGVRWQVPLAFRRCLQIAPPPVGLGNVWVVHQTE